MNRYAFKTNINCSGCVEKVTPAINKLQGVISWEVDTNNPSKILNVEAEDGVPAEAVEEVVKGVGFNIEKLS
ncbi:heavy-metal-associated domain-containing protein [Arcticibacter sp. MXS-1]|uniref:heavy-metal-associated domain-containing protein n=1 Tax=Arcticibacter sp. MXS-1 TaxID=3341726 RepID=UPI0035A84984